MKSKYLTIFLALLLVAPVLHAQKPKTTVDFGAETLRAVKEFQKKHDLVVDGIVGPKTWKALMEDA